MTEEQIKLPDLFYTEIPQEARETFEDASGRKLSIVGFGIKRADQFVVNPDNFRKHPQSQQRAVDGSLASLGWIDVVIESRESGFVLDGHERVWNALKNNNGYVPYIHVELTEDQDAQALLSLDPIAEMAVDDKEKKELLLKRIAEAAKEKPLGENVKEFLSDLAERSKVENPFAEEKPPDPGADLDRAEELQKKWGVKSGDLFKLGDHRLICGDCTDEAVVERLMGGEKAGAVVTDPPYNVDKDIWDTDVLPMLGKAGKLLPNIVGDGVVFWFTSTRYLIQIANVMSLPYRWLFIWYPSNNMAHGDLGFQKFTPALVLSTGKIHRKRMQDLREYPIKITKVDPLHPTPKPIEVIEYIVDNIDVDLYFDGFLGSGTTLIACERLGRKCFGIEIEPKYVAVTLERYFQMTGNQPELITP